MKSSETLRDCCTFVQTLSIFRVAVNAGAMRARATREVSAAIARTVTSSSLTTGMAVTGSAHKSETIPGSHGRSCSHWLLGVHQLQLADVAVLFSDNLLKVSNDQL